MSTAGPPGGGGDGIAQVVERLHKAGQLALGRLDGSRAAVQWDGRSPLFNRKALIVCRSSSWLAAAAATFSHLRQLVSATVSVESESSRTTKTTRVSAQFNCVAYFALVSSSPRSSNRLSGGFARIHRFKVAVRAFVWRRPLVAHLRSLSAKAAPAHWAH